MSYPAILLLALEHARNGDFQRCRDMLYDFAPGSLDDEQCVDYCWKRLAELESRAQRKVA